MKRLLPIALTLFVCFPVLAGEIQDPGKKPPPPPPPAITTEKTDTADTSDDELTTYTVADLAFWLLTSLVNP